MRWIIAGIALVILSLSTPAIGSFHETTGSVPDRAFTLMMSGTSFNGLHAPNTPLLEGYLGERTRFITLATEPHTFHLHGHPWLSEGRVIDTFLVDADRPHAFDVLAGGVDAYPGDWMYHCHINSHLQAGMWGIFRVYPYSFSLTLPGEGEGTGEGTGTGPGTMLVTLARMGVPVDGATIELSVDGVVLPAHVEPLGDGEYALHATLPAAGALVATATHPELGVSVARASLGDAAHEMPATLGAMDHAHDP